MPVAPAEEPVVADGQAYVDPALLAEAEANRDARFKVIVQGAEGKRGDVLARFIAREAAKSLSGSSDQNELKVLREQIREQFRSVDGLAAELNGKQIVRLAKRKGVLAITRDVPVALASFKGFPSTQIWPYSTGVVAGWLKPAASVPDDRDRRLGHRREPRRLRRPGRRRGQPRPRCRTTRPATAAATARSSPASPPARRRATPAPRRTRSSSRSTYGRRRHGRARAT